MDCFRGSMDRLAFDDVELTYELEEGGERIDRGRRQRSGRAKWNELIVRPARM
jgi:hypothetical protein